MKIYVAAPWAHKNEAKDVAEFLKGEGLHVTAHWIDRPPSAYELDPALMRSEALRDLEDIDQADAILYLNLKKSEGKATEMGYALAKGIPIYAVGGTTGNVFLHLPSIRHLASVEEFVDSVAGK